MQNLQKNTAIDWDKLFSTLPQKYRRFFVPQRRCVFTTLPQKFRDFSDSEEDEEFDRKNYFRVLQTYLCHSKQISLDILRSLIATGETFIEGSDMLYRAACNSSATLDIFKLLIEAGATVNDGTLPTYLEATTAENFCPEIVKLFLDAGTKDDSINKALRILFERFSMTGEFAQKFKQTAYILMEAGAKVQCEYYDEDKFIHVLFNVFNGDCQADDIIEVATWFMVRGIDISIITNYDGSSVLQKYLFGNDDPKEEVVQFLIQSGVNVNHTDDSNWNALFTYLLFSDGRLKLSICKMLIEAGINVNQLDCYQSTAVCELTNHLQREETPEVLRMIIEAGFDLKNVSIDKLQQFESVPDCKLAILNGFQTDYLVMLKMLHLKNEMDPKRSLARIPTGVFREIFTYF